MLRLMRFYHKQIRGQFILFSLIALSFNLIFFLSAILSNTIEPPIAIPLTFLLCVALAWQMLRQDTNKFTVTLAISTENNETERFLAKLTASLAQSGFLFLITFFFRLILFMMGRSSNPENLNFTSAAFFPLALIALTGALAAYFVIPYSVFEEQLQRKIGKLALVIPAILFVLLTGILRRSAYELFRTSPFALNNPSISGLYVLLLHLLICFGIIFLFIRRRINRDFI